VGADQVLDGVVAEQAANSVETGGRWEARSLRTPVPVSHQSVQQVATEGGGQARIIRVKKIPMTTLGRVLEGVFIPILPRVLRGRLFMTRPVGGPKAAMARP